MKKFLLTVLALMMLLGAFPAASFAANYPNIVITDDSLGFVNTEIDGKSVTCLGLNIWKTSGMPLYTNTKYDWHLTFYYEGETEFLQLDPCDFSNEIYYFDIVSAYFIPEKGTLYSVAVEITDENGKSVFWSDYHQGFICDVDPIIPDDLGNVGQMYDLTLEAVAPAWKWMEKADQKVLTLTFKITDAEGNAVIIDGEWNLAIAPEDAEDGAMLALTPDSVKNGVYVFEIPLDEFTPEKGVDYLLMVYFMDLESGEVHMSMPTEGFLYDLAETASDDDGKENDDLKSEEEEIKEEENSNEEEPKENGLVVMIVLIAAAAVAAVGAGIGIFVSIKKKRS